MGLISKDGADGRVSNIRYYGARDAPRSPNVESFRAEL